MIKKVTFFLLGMAMTLSLSSQNFPGKEWTFNEHPENDGWDIEKGMEFYRYIIDSTHVTGLVIVHKGQIILDYGDIEELSYYSFLQKECSGYVVRKVC